MKWTEIVTHLQFPRRCSCGETAHDVPQAFEHYRRGHILHHCPECGGKLGIPSVRGQYGAKDNSKYICYSCWLEYDADLIRAGQAVEGTRAH